MAPCVGVNCYGTLVKCYGALCPLDSVPPSHPPPTHATHPPPHTPHPSPHLQAGSCIYFYSSYYTPLITSYSPATYDASVTGTTLTLFSSSLPATADALNITVDGLPCPVTYVNATTATAVSVNCTLPDMPAGRRYVRTEVAGQGWAEMPGGANQGEVDYVVRVTGVSPQARGSFWGGQLLSLTGYGFAPTGMRTLWAGGGASYTHLRGRGRGARAHTVGVGCEWRGRV